MERSNLDGMQALAGHGRIHFDGRQIKPESVAILQGVQADPVNHARIIAAEFEHGSCRRTVHEMESADRARSHEVEAANTVAGNAIQIVVTSRNRQADQLDEVFVAFGEVLAKTQKALAVLAEGIQTRGDGSAVRP